MLMQLGDAVEVDVVVVAVVVVGDDIVVVFNQTMY